ncbi:MAG: hypothetical protein ABR953_10360 [Candidatus Acidiferrales bacterium]
MRLICELTQQELSSATGVPMYRISGAETGRLHLNVAEQHLLINFLNKCWMNISKTAHMYPAVEVRA